MTNNDSYHYVMPELPENQRWNVKKWDRFMIIKLQEKRWWGWRTIAKGTRYLSGGVWALSESVDQILRRDYYDRLDAEKQAQRQRSIDAIPFGKTR